MAERHRSQIERMIDAMITLRMSEQDIQTAICNEYRPYHTFPEFQEGFADYQARRRHEKYDGYKAQAYDRGANAAMWLWQAQQRMKPPAK